MSKTIEIGGAAIAVPPSASGSADRETRDKRPRAISNGMLLYPFLFALFSENEKSNRRLNDGQLELIVRHEFAGSEVIQSIDTCNTSRVSIWRSRYNAGVMGPPTYCAFRYFGGKCIDSRTASHVLTDQQQYKIVKKYKIPDPRFKR